MSELSEAYRKVCVVGLGYIGLPTASLLATKGFDVHGVDVHRHVVDTINEGRVHIVEPDLDILVKSAVGSGRLKAGLEAEPADIFIIAVPTPFKEGNRPDLTYVEDATRALAPHVAKGSLIILESTSPVETTEKIAGWLAEERPDLRFPHRGEDVGSDVYLAHCPERVLPGNILHELVENDRIVGGINPASAAVAEAFYKRFVHGDVLVTDSRTAELAKLSENAFRDVNIAYANELANICERLDINVFELVELANHHPRVNILTPGIGVGGHCIPVDPWFIYDAVPDEARLIRAAREINNARPPQLVAKIAAAAGRAGGAPVALLGLAYKPDVDDLRESPAVEVAVALADALDQPILIAEPHIDALPPKLAGRDHVRLADTATALKDAAVVAMLVNHRAFREHAPPGGDTVVIDPLGAWGGGA